jgi:hypothetical protein
MSEPLLVVETSTAIYGTAHVLQGVSFTMGPSRCADRPQRHGQVDALRAPGPLLRRPPAPSGSRPELLGKPAYKVAGRGDRLRAAGRRLFESLTVDEHSTSFERPRGAVDARALSTSYSAARERKNSLWSAHRCLRRRGSRCSLHRVRALRHQSAVLIMDETSEGLAPVDRRGTRADDQGPRRRWLDGSWSSSRTRVATSRRERFSSSW